MGDARVLAAACTGEVASLGSGTFEGDAGVAASGAASATSRSTTTAEGADAGHDATVHARDAAQPLADAARETAAQMPDATRDVVQSKPDATHDALADVRGDAGCPLGSVTVRMLASPGSAYQAPIGEPSETPIWYNLEGVATQLGLYNSCSACKCNSPTPHDGPCSTLVALGTELGIYAVPEAGVTWTWDGLAVAGCNAPNPFEANEVCQASCDVPRAGDVPCGDTVCMPAGTYTVTACTVHGPCVSVPFDYPTRSEVLAIIPGPDAGHDGGSAEPPESGVDAGDAGNPHDAAVPLDAPLPLLDGAGCPFGSVTFRMLTPPGYDYVQFGNPPEYAYADPPWYSLNGVAWYIEAYTLCDTCRPPNELPYCQEDPVPAGGVTWTWPGTTVAPCAPYAFGHASCSDTCDSTYAGRVVSCGNLACMPAGHYTATLCASNGGSDCDYGQECVTVGFDYPTSGEVVGVVGGAGDAGLDAGEDAATEDAAASATGS